MVFNDDEIGEPVMELPSPLWREKERKTKYLKMLRIRRKKAFFAEAQKFFP